MGQNMGQGWPLTHYKNAFSFPLMCQSLDHTAKLFLLISLVGTIYAYLLKSALESGFYECSDCLIPTLKRKDFSAHGEKKIREVNCVLGHPE